MRYARVKIIRKKIWKKTHGRQDNNKWPIVSVVVFACAFTLSIFVFRNPKYRRWRARITLNHERKMQLSECVSSDYYIIIWYEDGVAVAIHSFSNVYGQRDYDDGIRWRRRHCRLWHVGMNIEHEIKERKKNNKNKTSQNDYVLFAGRLPIRCEYCAYYAHNVSRL